ncbi:hypothetical protein JK636_23025 [Clostridium sp. YIM B02515]|uniref:RiboL-PSP-HEPN domain-containing protein n=1 Tax=Clostridium rhizosphaerae TaxID=2803861 RepID=A0ABS1TGS3_9CLOT|nr:hypothetical protein [Clostridium rhizosphaerae]MBL4938581.1 hypothetical protein [Clostridium rhizosphaerae]
MESEGILNELSRDSKHSLFYSISKKHFSNLNRLKNKLKDFYAKLEIIEKQVEEQETEELCKQEYKMLKRIDVLEKKIEFEAISSIIFSALFLEAYIYDYGARRLGDNFIKEHIDKLDPMSKIVVITQLVLEKPFPKDRDIYGRLKSLIKSRNSLVHNKSHKIDLSKFKNYIEKRDVELIELIKEGLDAYETIYDFLQFMLEIDSNESFQINLLI